MHPDSFIIEEQLNVHPFSSENILGPQKGNLVFYQDITDSLRLNNLKNKIEIKKFNKVVDSLWPLVNKASREHEDAIFKNAEIWKRKQVPNELIKKLHKINENINALETYNGNDLKIANLNVERTKTEYEISIINLKSSNYVLENFIKFQDPTIRQEISKLDSLYTLYKYKLIPQKDNEISKFNNEMYELRFQRLNNLRKRISYLDFLLFSASNSSTVTYGEIVPNDNSSRLTLFIQAVFCIILITLLTDSIINRRITRHKVSATNQT